MNTAASVPSAASVAELGNDELISLPMEQLLATEFLSSRNMLSAADTESMASLQSTAIEESAKEYANAGLKPATLSDDTVDRLSRELAALALSSGASSTSSLLSARVGLLRRVQSAFHLEAQRLQTLVTSSAQSLASQSKASSTAAEPSFAAMAQLVMTHLKHSAAGNPTQCEHMLAQLLAWFKTSSPFPTSPVWDGLAHLLTVLTMRGPTPRARNLATSCLACLALLRNSASDSLHVVSMLIDAPAHESYEVLHLLHAFQRKELSCMPIPSVGTMPSKQFTMEVDLNGCAFATVASDGTYMYLHCTRGLFKIGTGVNATTPGTVYDSLLEYRPEQSSMAVVNGLLYLRTATMEPGTLFYVLRCDRLAETGAVAVDGSASIATEDLTAAFASLLLDGGEAPSVAPASGAGAAASGTPPTTATGEKKKKKKKKKKRAAVLAGAPFTRLIGDGRCVYVIANTAAGTDASPRAVTVTALDPTRACSAVHSAALHRPTAATVLQSVPKGSSTILGGKLFASTKRSRESYTRVTEGVVLPPAPHLDVLASDFTAEVWFCLPDVKAGLSMGSGPPLSTNALLLMAYTVASTATSPFYVFASPQGVGLRQTGGSDASIDVRLSPDALTSWVHVAATFCAATATTTLYVNGVAHKAQGATPGGHHPPTRVSVLRGSAQSGGGRFAFPTPAATTSVASTAQLSGGHWLFGSKTDLSTVQSFRLCDCRLWSTCLSNDDVTDALHTAVPPTADGLLGAWPLNSATGVVAVDATHHACHGALWDVEYAEVKRPVEAASGAAPESAATAALRKMTMYTNGEHLVAFHPFTPSDLLPGGPGYVGVYQVWSLATGELVSEDVVNMQRCMLGVSHCMGAFPSADLHGVGVVVGPDGTSRVSVIRRIAMPRKPSAPAPWHTALGVGSAMTSSLQSLLGDCALPPLPSPKDKDAPMEYVDPFSPTEDAFADRPVDDAGTVTAATLINFLLRLLEDQVEADRSSMLALAEGNTAPAAAPGTAATPTPSMDVTARRSTFHVMRRLLAQCGSAYAREGTSGDGTWDALQMHALLVTVKVLKHHVLALKGFTGYQPVLATGVVDGDTAAGDSPTAPFVTQLNHLLRVGAATDVARVVQPALCEELVSTLTSCFAVFSPKPADRLRVLLELAATSVREQSGGTHGSDTTRAELTHRYFEAMSTPDQVVATMRVTDNAVRHPDSVALMHTVVTLLTQHAESAVLNAAAASGPRVVGLPPAVSALRSWLVKAQSQLWYGVRAPQPWAAPTDTSPYSLAVKHAVSLMDAWSELCEFCATTAGVDWSRGDADASVIDRKSEVVRGLQLTLGALLDALLAHLSTATLRLPEVATVLPCLRRMLAAVDTLAVGLPEVVAAEADWCTGRTRWKRATKAVSFDTPHPLTSYGPCPVKVALPGSSYLSLEFAAQTRESFTQGATIGLFADQAGSQPADVAGGTHLLHDMPGGPLKVTGDTVWVIATPSSYAGVYGFSVTATATVDTEVTSLPWLLELHRNVANVAAKLAAGLLQGRAPGGTTASSPAVTLDGSDSSDDEGEGGKPRRRRLPPPPKADTVRRWEANGLLAGGIGVASPEEAEHEVAFQRSLQDLLQAVGLESASDLFPAMDTLPAEVILGLAQEAATRLADVSVDAFPVASEAAALVPTTVLHVFAVLLVHNHLLPAAQAALAAPTGAEVPVDLVRAWKAAHRYKRDLVMGYQAAVAQVITAAEAKREAAAADQESKAPAAEEESKAVDPAADDIVIDKAKIYGRLCRRVERRCQLLLSFRPAPLTAAPSPLLVRADSMASTSSDADTSSAQQAAESVLAAWQAASGGQDTSLSNASPDMRPSLVWRKVVTLLKDPDFTPGAARGVFVRKRRQAALRLAGLRTLTVLVGAATVPSVAREIVSRIPTALSGPAAAAKGMPPDLDAVLTGSSTALTLHLEAAFSGLMKALLGLLGGASSPPLVKSVLHCFAARYTAPQFTMLVNLGIFKSLRKVLQDIHEAAAPGAPPEPEAAESKLGDAGGAAAGAGGAEETTTQHDPDAHESVKTAAWATLDLLATTCLRFPGVSSGDVFAPMHNTMMLSLQDVATSMRLRRRQPVPQPSTAGSQAAVPAGARTKARRKLTRRRNRGDVVQTVAPTPEAAKVSGVTRFGISVASSSGDTATDADATFDDGFAVKLLALVHRMCASSAEALSHPDAVAPLLVILATGTPRSRMLAAQVLGSIAAKADPAGFDAVVPDTAWSDGLAAVEGPPGTATVEFVLHVLGQAVGSGLLASLSLDKACAVRHGSLLESVLTSALFMSATVPGDAIQPKAAILALARGLVAAPSWRPAVQAALSHMLKADLPLVHRTLSGFRESDAGTELAHLTTEAAYLRLWRCFGTLSVMGDVVPLGAHTAVVDGNVDTFTTVSRVGETVTLWDSSTGATVTKPQHELQPCPQLLEAGTLVPPADLAAAMGSLVAVVESCAHNPATKGTAATWSPSFASLAVSSLQLFATRALHCMLLSSACAASMTPAAVSSLLALQRRPLVHASQLCSMAQEDSAAHVMAQLGRPEHMSLPPMFRASVRFRAGKGYVRNSAGTAEFKELVSPAPANVTTWRPPADDTTVPVVDNAVMSYVALNEAPTVEACASKIVVLDAVVRGDWLERLTAAVDAGAAAVVLVVPNEGRALHALQVAPSRQLAVTTIDDEDEENPVVPPAFPPVACPVMCLVAAGAVLAALKVPSDLLPGVLLPAMNMSELLALGYTRGMCAQALEHTGQNLDAAAEWLVENSKFERTQQELMASLDADVRKEEAARVAAEAAEATKVAQEATEKAAAARLAAATGGGKEAESDDDDDGGHVRHRRTEHKAQEDDDVVVALPSAGQMLRGDAADFPLADKWSLFRVATVSAMERYEGRSSKAGGSLWLQAGKQAHLAYMSTPNLLHSWASVCESLGQDYVQRCLVALLLHWPHRSAPLTTVCQPPTVVGTLLVLAMQVEPHPAATVASAAKAVQSQVVGILPVADVGQQARRVVLESFAAVTTFTTLDATHTTLVDMDDVFPTPQAPCEVHAAGAVNFVLSTTADTTGCQVTATGRAGAGAFVLGSVHQQINGETVKIEVAPISNAVAAAPLYVTVHVKATMPSHLVNDKKKQTVPLPVSLSIATALSSLPLPTVTADAGGALPAAALDDVQLCHMLLTVLPHVRDASQADTACRTLIKLFQRLHAWLSEFPAGRNAPAVAALFAFYPKLQRAHAWLRTTTLRAWTGSSMLAPHIQQLVELILSVAHTMRPPGVSALPVDIDDVDRSYLLGREGPQVCSLIDLTQRWAPPSGCDVVTSRTGVWHEAYVADVCLRAGKWYFEVEVVDGPEPGETLHQLSVGVVTARFNPATHAGTDMAAWVFSSKDDTFMHANIVTSLGTVQAQHGVGGDAGAVAAKKKRAGGPAARYGGSRLQVGSVLGVGVDFDAGSVWFRINDEEPLMAFPVATLSDGVFPFLCVRSTPASRHVTATYRMKLGRTGFTFAPPDGYLPVETDRPSASWEARFQLAAEVTKAVHLRQPLTPAVVGLAFAREKAATDARRLTLAPLKSDNPSVNMEFLGNDDAGMVVSLPVDTATHLCFRAPDAEVILTKVMLRVGRAGLHNFKAMVFVGSDPIELHRLSWCGSMTEAHFNSFLARQREAAAGGAATGAGDSAAPDAANVANVDLPPPQPHEPVAFLSSTGLADSQRDFFVELSRPVAAKFVVVQVTVARSSSDVPLETVHFMGLPGMHPLRDVVGRPSFPEEASALLQRLEGVATSQSMWPVEADEALVELVVTMSRGAGVDPLDLDIVMLDTSPAVGRFKVLEPYAADDLRARLATLKFLNSLVTPLLNFADLSAPDDGGAGLHVSGGALTLASVVHRLSRLYFTSTKLAVLEALLSLDVGQTSMARVRVQVNRLLARERKPEADPAGLQTVFGQLHAGLKHHPWASFRQLAPNVQPWTCDLLGEGSIDAGGAFREVLVLACDDLMGDDLQLFVPCGNAVNGIGINREKRVVNPAAARAPANEELYTFVGFLLGVALRVKFPLPLDLPSILWKGLLGQTPNADDLEAVDKLCLQALDGLRAMPVEAFGPSGVVQETFAGLVPGGDAVPVTADNVEEYAALTVAARLRESKPAVAAMRNGLNYVIPVRMLSILSWHELEFLCCGSGVIDVDLLRRHTTYRGEYNATHAVIRNFWTALESFTQDERQQFLRFVWGRNRLPTAATDWAQPFTIDAVTSVASTTTMDEALPVSHTCFFSLNLPMYSSYAVLRERLLFACAHCVAIDSDYVPSESQVATWRDL